MLHSVRCSVIPNVIPFTSSLFAFSRVCGPLNNPPVFGGVPFSFRALCDTVFGFIYLLGTRIAVCHFGELATLRTRRGNPRVVTLPLSRQPRFLLGQGLLEERSQSSTKIINRLDRAEHHLHLIGHIS